MLNCTLQAASAQSGGQDLLQEVPSVAEQQAGRGEHHREPRQAGEAAEDRQHQGQGHQGRDRRQETAGAGGVGTPGQVTFNLLTSHWSKHNVT